MRGMKVAVLTDELAQAITKGQVQSLVILGGNPAYNAPVDLEFAALMKQVEVTIRLGCHVDETSRHAEGRSPAPASTRSGAV